MVRNKKKIKSSHVLCTYFIYLCSFNKFKQFERKQAKFVTIH
jgi:hypothetical protein